jgi:hypothetical protein
VSIERMKAVFKEFFDDRNANVEWDGWDEGLVLVDDVFNLDELLTRLADAANEPDVH